MESRSTLNPEEDVFRYRQAEQFYLGQNEVLELLAQGHSLDDILTHLAHIIERQVPGIISSILLFDPITQCLHHGAAPNLPKEYIKAIDGIRTGERVGSCGTAAYEGKLIIVDNIETDPLWTEYRDVALRHNLRACWSQPILCATGRLLGTFAMYYQKPYSPHQYELELIKKAANLAAIAINRKQQEEALHSIAAGTASVTGSEFLHSLVYHFSLAMRVRCAILTEWNDPAKNVVRTLAFWTGNEFANDIEYHPAGTPCENALAGNMSYYPNDVQKLFPEDKKLSRLGAKSYLGLPLFDSFGNILGHIAALGDKPIFSDPRGLSVLKIFAARAGAELERKQGVQALRDANANLEIRVAERTAELSKANFLLKQEIKEHESTQKVLKASEERYRRVADTAQEGIWILRENGTTSFINQEMLKILGYAGGEISDHLFFDFVDISLRKEAKRYLERIKSGVAEKHEVLFRRKNGSPCWAMVSANSLTDDGGRILGTLCMISDITDRKRLEKEILEVSHWEQHRIGQDLHDDLGQLLTGIAFKAKVLEKRLVENSSPEATSAVEIVKLIKHAIDKTHNVARGLCHVELEANGLMSALAEMAANVDDRQNVSCMFECDEPVLIHNSSVATNLFRIAQEATHNAIKHSKGKHVWVRLTYGDNQVIMTVEDNGIGFPTSLKPGKTMGLYLMRYRAKMINGHLDVFRTDRGGTSVVCTVQDDRQCPLNGGTTK